jgi:hypothetical protein
MGISTPFHSKPSGGIAAYMTSCATVDDEPQRKKGCATETDMHGDTTS